MTETDFTALAELVFKSQHYPSHLIVTRNVKTLPDGIWASVVDDYATKSYIEVALREAVAQGREPLLGLWEHKPKVHVYKQEIYISEELLADIQLKLKDSGVDESEFCAYMKVVGLSAITEKEHKKALNAIETIKKAKK